MAKHKGSSAHQKVLYKAYRVEERWRKNRANRLARHLAKHPNDKQAENAKIVYRRSNFKHLKKESQPPKLAKQPLDPRIDFREIVREIREIGNFKKFGNFRRAKRA